MNIQLKIFAPVGIEMIMVVIPKNEFTSAPEPIVKKWVQPHEVGEDGDDHQRVDHRGVAEQALAAEGRGDLREHPEGGQDQDVDLRVTPDPDQVEVQHGVAAEVVREEVRADVAVERQHRENGREDREGGHDQDVGAQRRPDEDRQLHHGHAGRPHLHDGGDQVDAREQRPDTGDLQRPDVVVDADAGAHRRPGEGRVGEPGGAGELADEQRDHHQQAAGDRHPETEVVQEREGDVAGADLQRHGEVHEPRDERHRHEEDHDHAVGGEDLVVVVRRQEALLIAEGDRLLGAHQDRVGEAAQQHDAREDAVHDADLLVVDRRDPVTPHRPPEAVVGDDAQHGEADDGHAGERRLQDRLVIGDLLDRKSPDEQLL
ncbi:hypothetical protein ABIC20_006289 [Methylobacterium radiotolerans]|uniref:Uncharacterized protein n=1 Tax=Methylobacterium radiotolerans TaxID=31998 RepID=A0ABV2NRL6_9HYPH